MTGYIERDYGEQKFSWRLRLALLVLLGAIIREHCSNLTITVGKEAGE